eukprot:snap_masked-scaffold_35-processed-gene-2.45-mRNA-1 protein AED:1.00 eAED:1.00 QI:0/-1/0/0/-1/1/1/0/64
MENIGGKDVGQEISVNVLEDILTPGPLWLRKILPHEWGYRETSLNYSYSSAITVISTNTAFFKY